VGPLADKVLPDWYAGVPRVATSIAAAAAQRWPDAELRLADGADHVALRLPDGRYLGATDGRALAPAAGGLGAAARLGVTDWGWGLLTFTDLATERLWTTDDRAIVRAEAERPHGWVVQESFRQRTDQDGLVALQHVGSGRWLRLDAAEQLVATAATPQEATRFARHTLRSGAAAVADAAAGADLVLCALGNDPHLLGRETEDRPALELPPSQLTLWESVHERAPGAVLAIVSSYPYAFDLDARTVLWTTHSQAVGHSVVDIVSGDVAPSGRLPQTWWRSTADAGDLTDYDIVAGRSTSWYSAAEPLFAFGHGLTGSRIGYRALDLVDQDETGVTVEVSIRNDGGTSATEVVQVYTDALAHRFRFPHRLGGHARVVLAPGEERRVRVHVPRERFAFWDTARGAMTIDPGRYVLSAGPSARELPLRVEIELEGPDPVPHRMPLRAASFDDLAGVVLDDETPERGTAISGPGWAVFDDVDGLPDRPVVRVARSGPGAASVELAVREHAGGDWCTVASAAVPAGLGRYDWTDVTTAPTGATPRVRGPLRVVLTGPARLAAIS
jgi:beta-glucosidase